MPWTVLDRPSMTVRRAWAVPLRCTGRASTMSRGEVCDAALDGRRDRRDPVGRLLHDLGVLTAGPSEHEAARRPIVGVPPLQAPFRTAVLGPAEPALLLPMPFRVRGSEKLRR